jgi:hypothetical protein
MEEEKKGSGFVIKDKRFTDESEAAKSQEEKSTTSEEPKSAFPESPKAEKKDDMQYPPVNFTNFVLSLSTSALFHFGDFPDHEGGLPQKNMPAAKQTIDILDMMHEKTKGNLDDNERNLIQGVLYELKLRFVKETS